MKTFKKLLAFLCVLMLVFAMTACGDSDDDDSSKKGSSRKKDNTEQSDTPTPTEDPDPTDKPNPTDAPTDTPTPTPTNTPSPEPTDEPEPTPFAVGELNYSVIKGDWKATRSFTMDEAKEFLEGYMDDEDTKIFLSVMKDAGMNPKVNVDFTLSFTSEKDVKITYKADALEFLNAIKQLFSDEESAYKLMEAYTGMSVDVLKTYIASTGMKLTDLLADYMDEFDGLEEQMVTSEEMKVEYEIVDGKIIFDNSPEVYGLYSSGKIKFIVDDPKALGEEATFLFKDLEFSR